MKRTYLGDTLQACESALIAMVKQYCYRPKLQEDGKPEVFSHDFMLAGEEAFLYLVVNGLAEYTENGVDIVFREDVKND